MPTLCPLRQIDPERDLSTCEEFRAAITLSPDFARELHDICPLESQLLEEPRLVGEGERAGQAYRPCLVETGLNQGCANPFA